MSKAGITVTGAKQTQAMLRQVARQLPFATAQALNQTARQAAADLNQSIGATFNRVSPFTARAVAVSVLSSARSPSRSSVSASASSSPGAACVGDVAVCRAGVVVTADTEADNASATTSARWKRTRGLFQCIDDGAGFC